MLTTKGRHSQIRQPSRLRSNSGEDNCEKRKKKHREGKVKKQKCCGGSSTGHTSYACSLTFRDLQSLIKRDNLIWITGNRNIDCTALGDACVERY